MNYDWPLTSSRESTSGEDIQHTDGLSTAEMPVDACHVGWSTVRRGLILYGSRMVELLGGILLLWTQRLLIVLKNEHIHKGQNWNIHHIIVRHRMPAESPLDWPLLHYTDSLLMPIQPPTVGERHSLPVAWEWQI